MKTRGLTKQILRQERSLPHEPRKIYHMVMGLICFALYSLFLTQSQSLWALGLIGGTIVAFDIIRFFSPKARQLALLVFGPLMRREELKSLTGNSFFIVGIFIVVFVFSKPIALLGILYLALGDPAAAIVGARFGKRRLWGKKSLEGALANFFICFLGTLFVTSVMWYYPFDRCLVIALVGGLSSMIAECLPLSIDDNLTIPVVSSSILFLLQTWYSLF